MGTSRNMLVRPRIEQFTGFWPLLIAVLLIYLTGPDASVQSNMPPKALPHPLAITLIHYATSKITPQLTSEELMVTASILSQRGPCNFLVYGLGFDSPLWEALNHGSRTVFLEDDPSWIARMTEAHPTLEAYLVNYTTTVSEAEDLLVYATSEHRKICSAEQNWMTSGCKLVLKLPEHLFRIKWDVIMIDAPKGYLPELPGRMMPIYTSAMMARVSVPERSTDILLHNAARPVETMYTTEFFGAKNLIQSVGKLSHFQLFGEGASPKTDL